MKIAFPSREFDEAVADVCHGTASHEQAQALNELLRGNPAARDEYILRLELHSRLASEPDLFARPGQAEIASPENIVPLSGIRRAGIQKRTWVYALAASVAVLATAWWALQHFGAAEPKGATSKAVAMLNQVVDARWSQRSEPRLGSPLEPGPLRLESGLAQIVFYNGARVVIEGPTELQLISAGEASCVAGRLTAEVPPQAQGFRIRTPEMNVTDLGTAFGLDVKDGRTEVHVFRGSVEFEPAVGRLKQQLKEGAGAVVQGTGAPRLIAANQEAFASLFDLQSKSSDAQVLRHEQWRAASAELDEDPSLLVHFDFEPADQGGWRLPNKSSRNGASPDATIVGCQWVEGRWPEKQALEFRGVSDRVRLSVAGEFESLTLAGWVRVHGLDRRVNSLFMSDSFDPGTLHWLILNDGAPTLTVVGSPGSRLQIVSGPPVLTLDKFGMWQHVAVVVDGRGGQVVHYLNGRALNRTPLKIEPPFRIGSAELGNWNARGFKGDDSLMIRNFSGAMDEFCVFGRALTAEDIRTLYYQGKPQPGAVASGE